MATAVHHRTIVNPARGVRKNRHFSAKQIRAGFGGRRRKLAARHNKRNAAKPRSNTPKVKANRHHHRNTPKAANRAPQRNRQNPGEILSFTLGNPARKANMAAKAAVKKNRRHGHHHKNNPAKKTNVRKNASASYSKRPLFMNKAQMNAIMKAKTNKRRHHKPNPGGESMTALLFDGVFVIGGMVSTRLLTQLVLGANNTGVWGYAGNAAATAAVAMGAHMLKAGPRVVNALVIGGAAAIVARIISDYTPFGTYLQQAGFGDYAGGGGHGVGLYLPSNSVLPQRYVNAATSAQVQIPSPGWAPTTVIQAPAPAAAGVSGLYSNRRSRRLY